jgi:hypothetical protein
MENIFKRKVFNELSLLPAKFEIAVIWSDIITIKDAVKKATNININTAVEGI